MSESAVSILNEPYMTVEEVAAILKVHPATIRNRIKNGDLPALKIGKEYRVARRHLEKFVEHTATSVYREYVELLEREAEAIATIGARAA